MTRVALRVTAIVIAVLTTGFAMPVPAISAGVSGVERESPHTLAVDAYGAPYVPLGADIPGDDARRRVFFISALKLLPQLAPGVGGEIFYRREIEPDFEIDAGPDPVAVIEALLPFVPVILALLGLIVLAAGDVRAVAPPPLSSSRRRRPPPPQG